MSWSRGMSLRSLLFAPGLISATLLAGCAGEPVETLVPVGGKLLVDGKPLDGVVVTFIPEISENNGGGDGTTDDSGAFTVTNLKQNKPGLPPGKYTLIYSRMRYPDGSAAPAIEPNKPIPPGPVRVEALPSFLTIPDPNDPSRTVEIPEEGNSNLELKASLKKSSGPKGPPAGPG
jgi:hypothetical protein